MEISMLIVWLPRFSTIGRQSCACKEFFACGSAIKASPRSKCGGSERNYICNMPQGKASCPSKSFCVVAIFFHLTESTISTFFEGVYRHCVVFQETLKDPWDLNASRTQDLSQRETWVANIWVDP